MRARLPFDRVASIYDETRAIPAKIMARLVHLLLEQLHGKEVLEVGVGTGRFAVPLQKSGIDVVGIDISRGMVELGLAKGLRAVIFADGARLPFAPRSFDVSMTNHVLHLVPDWRDVLLEIARVTRESYVTMIEKDEGQWSLKREYDRLAAEGGHAWKAPGLHERDLPGVLRPDVVMPVGPFTQTVPANAILAELERRDYSSQWEVPEDLHRKVMGSLRERWAAREILRSVTVDVCFWPIGRLAELARADVHTS